MQSTSTAASPFQRYGVPTLAPPPEMNPLCTTPAVVADEALRANAPIHPLGEATPNAQAPESTRYLAVVARLTFPGSFLRRHVDKERDGFARHVIRKHHQAEREGDWQRAEGAR